MVKIKKYIKYISVMAIFFAINIEAMNIGGKTRLTALKKKSEKLKEIKIKEKIKNVVEKTVATLQPGEYFVHAAGAVEGEIVSGDVLKQSEYFKNWLEMKPNDKEIPITGDYSIIDIKIFCDVLKNWFKKDNIKQMDRKKVEDDMQGLSFKKSIEIANMFTFFDVPEDIINIVLNKIKIDIGKEEDIDILANLNPDLQKPLLMTPAIRYLKNLIIKEKKFNKLDFTSRGKIIENDDNVIKINSDGTKIIVGGQNKLILWDISNLGHIVSYDLNMKLRGFHDLGKVTMVAFSQDGKQVVAFGHDMAINSNRLALWNIHNLENITCTVLAINIGLIQSAAFSPDGRKIITGGISSLRLWNLDSNTNTILLPVNNARGVTVIVFNQDGNKIVIGGIDHFKLLDITDPNNLTFYPLGISLAKISQMTISPNGSKIVASNSSSAGSYRATLVLCDIKDVDTKVKKITPFGLMNKLDNVLSLGFSHDDNEEIFLINKENADHIFTLLNISNLDNIIHQSIKIPKLIPLATDGNKIILKRNKHLVVVNLLTEGQKLLIHDIKNYNSEQIRLIYKLCLRVFKNQKIQSDQLNELEKKASEILPAPMQNLLQDIGCFSNQ